MKIDKQEKRMFIYFPAIGFILGLLSALIIPADSMIPFAIFGSLWIFLVVMFPAKD